METFHRIYLRLISVSFLSFQSLLHFIKSKFGLTSSFLMKWSFSQNYIFNKNSYAIFFLVSCLAAFIVDITFITLLLSQIYDCATSYRLFNAATPQNIMTTRKGSIYLQNVCYKCYKTYPANICWSSRRLQDVFKTCLEDVFSTSSG